MTQRSWQPPEFAHFERLIDQFSNVRLLVVGDLVLDEYLWGEVERVSPEAPVPIVHVTRESVMLGGAGNVVRNVVAMGAECVFCSAIGDDRDGDIVIDLLKELGVDHQGIVRVEGRPTTRKTRVVARSQQMLRVDRETLDTLPAAAAEQVFAAIEAGLTGADGVILEDYGKGLFSDDLVRRLMFRCGSADVPVAVDPKTQLELFHGASLLKPNLREAELLTGVTMRVRADLERIATRLRESIGGGDIVVTRGGDGMTIFSDGQPGVDVPTVSQELYDVQGAGDTTIALLSLSLRVGATLFEAAVIANAAARVVVEKIGTATLTRAELLLHLPAAIAAAERPS